MVGGRIGKDGIHGATFSSEGLSESSPVSAVQLGDPYTQKKMLDFLLEARDLGLTKLANSVFEVVGPVAREEKLTYNEEDLVSDAEAVLWKIATDVLKKYTLAEIIAHYLWEITFVDFIQSKIKKQVDELHRRIKQVKKNPKKYTVPYDEGKIKQFLKKD